jgi:hypothetical protein
MESPEDLKRDADAIAESKGHILGNWIDIEGIMINRCVSCAKSAIIIEKPTSFEKQLDGDALNFDCDRDIDSDIDSDADADISSDLD